ncbi:hypothetical protein AXG93_3052s1110 [Marchantia polymorpha subsp. ruderalis]|uniref:Uncharacterized protein n=1 Tax=Marchantia polymorpha subsp. ruderalis TaxID=1480154 RepID=A0A176WJU9_MARPO|nr:hypothetical protein AXG93_3052s1110 [Marchantia polymorpha subsp. ruderalis]
MDDYHGFGREYVVEIDALGVIGLQCTCPLPRRVRGALALAFQQCFGLGLSGVLGTFCMLYNAVSWSASSSTSGGTRSGTSGSSGRAAGEGTGSGTSGVVGGGIRSDTSGRIGGAARGDTSTGTSSTAVGTLDGIASGVPTFSLIRDFFKSYLWCDKGTGFSILVPDFAQRFEEEGDHPLEQCFDLHPELRFGVRARDRAAPRDKDGRGDEGAGAGVIRRPVVDATSTVEAAVAAQIEQLEHMFAAMANSRARVPLFMKEKISLILKV